MKVKFTGSIHYANGKPVPDVEVRIYDQDASGKLDDDLTLIPGLSNERGRFSITYEPLRFMDYHMINATDTPSQPFNTPTSGFRMPDLGDLYLPYLLFNYTFNGQHRQQTAPLGIFQTEYRLPENPPVEFLPSSHGFKFSNQFSGYFLPFSAPAFMASRKVTSKYGLCGGMCAAAYDYALAGRAITGPSKVPRQGTRLQRYLFHRQIDTLGGFGQEVVKVARWTCLPDDTLLGIQARTADEFAATRQKLDDRNPVIMALIYENAHTLSQLSRLIFNNHQVLAYAYQQDASGLVSINVYDPNLPLRDDVVIQCKPLILGEVSSPAGSRPVIGYKSVQQLNGVFFRDVRGFFAMPYTSVLPPKGL